jgi:hypothetical protein
LPDRRLQRSGDLRRNPILKFKKFSARALVELRAKVLKTAPGNAEKLVP